MTQVDRTREHLIETYRKKAKHYDITSRLYPVPGYPQRAQRLRAVQALGLRAGDSVIDIACGTGLNFPLIEEVIGPDGRIVGVDLTDAMLARAQERIETNGWSNVSLVQADAVDFDFPAEVDAHYDVAVGLTADISHSLDALAAAVWRKAPAAGGERIRELLAEELARGQQDDRFPLAPARIVADTRTALGRELDAALRTRT